MSDIIADTMAHVPFGRDLSLEDYIETDAESRRVALSFINPK
jgi:hypothetical protein